MRLLFVSAVLCLLLESTRGLSCGECDHNNITASCGQPPSCPETVLDVCGCCPLCAKMEGESCGGPWDSSGTCAKGLTCQPGATAKPVLGAGGYFSENWDAVGTCVDPQKYRLEHNPCSLELRAFIEFQKSRGKRSLGHSKIKLEKFPDVDVTTEDSNASDTTTSAPLHVSEETTPLETSPEVETTTTMQVTTTTETTMTTTTTSATTETTTVACRRKPSCTPDGFYTPMQCDGCAGECWCSFHDGTEIQGTRGPVRTVRC